MEGRWYSVGIAAEGDRRVPKKAIPNLLDALADALETNSEIAGPVASWGGIAGGPGAQVSVEAEDPIEAAQIARGAFEKALVGLDIGAPSVAFLEVTTEEYQEGWSTAEAEEYVGLSEIAGILGVSRQRVFELRPREGFPRPIAELASGPVWRRSSLNHFIAGWSRKPGRPAKVKT